MDFASKKYGFSGLSLFLLGIALIGWTQYLAAGIVAMLVGIALMLMSGHYHFKEAESRANLP